MTSSSKHIHSQEPARSQPAMVYFTACPAREEWQDNYGVVLTVGKGVARDEKRFSCDVAPNGKGDSCHKRSEPDRRK
ncbi:hypothetical protein T459_26321 [Capsicum annuum]|uniref:Uncharacterized protein n=1 Tax=Capsicum annuum TaxID=4072 RepID=A0A2G2YN88_CAPAN|nr:hypothetical protein T459_26321 [Capsicum annuum]